MNEPIKIVTIIQARMGSTRLPHKVMMPLAGKPLLLRMYQRVDAANYTDIIIIATTEEEYDDPIISLCKDNDIKYYRGNSIDLLDRHYKAALPFNPDAVVKIPSDCPLIDPGIIDKVLKYYIDNKKLFDFVSNLHPASYPDGNDVEIFAASALKDAWLNAKKELEREHTTPYFWENQDKFNLGNVQWEIGKDYSMSHRFTIDYEQDYEFITRVYEELYTEDKIFTLQDILNLLGEKPEIKKINEKYAGVNWYRNQLDELKTITKKNTRNI
ncbi:MAG: glycosyltransferase family protein [Ignavibacteriaceae bacterium]